MARINFGYWILESENAAENVPMSNEILDFRKLLFMALFRFVLSKEWEFDSPENSTLIWFFPTIFILFPNYHHKTKLLLLIFILTAPFFCSHSVSLPSGHSHVCSVYEWD